MSREVDLRNPDLDRATPDRVGELRLLASEASDELPGEHRVRITSFDATTGNPSALVSESAPSVAGNYVQRALDHVQDVKEALGLLPTQPAEFVADPQVQQTSGGAAAVYLQQHYKAIPIFQAAQTVRFAPQGALVGVTGSTVSVEEDVPVSPTLPVHEAVLEAARHVAVPGPDELQARDQFGQALNPTGVDLIGFVPRVVAAFPNLASQPTVLEAGPFGDEIKASLTWFPLDAELRLAWEVILTMPDYATQWRAIVDAETARVLYCHELAHYVVARGRVFRTDGGGSRQMTDFPRPLTDFGLSGVDGLPGGFPDHWISGDKTEGNTVISRLGDSGSTIQGVYQDGVLTFDPADPAGDDQKVLNAFYLVCYMHDYFYALGFREESGNFQQDNFGRGGLTTDRVDTRVYSGAVRGTATMLTPVDGSSPIMKIGMLTTTRRHTAFDSSVVFHEFTHGVTNRLVGGPLNDQALEAPQSRGMAEGWSDYVACTVNNTTVVGAWVANRPGGIRLFPYDAKFPDNFGHLGTGRYAEAHNIGEIWCAALMEMNRRIGAPLGVQLVVDALKLSPANPGFLDMRDCILAALDNKRSSGQLSDGARAAARSGIWAAFAKFGMGPNAQSNGATLSGIVPDFNAPVEPGQQGARAETAQVVAIPDNNRTGITSTLAVSQAGKVTGLTVAVDIEHSYVGDLRVNLISPKGRTAALYNRTWSGTPNLVKSYTSKDNPALAALVGEEVQGEWKLSVADLGAGDSGRLRRWSLEAELERRP